MRLFISSELTDFVYNMEFIDINKTEPTKDYYRCEIITDCGRTIEVEYYEYWGIFMDDENEYGWKDNGENPELVVKWRWFE